MTEQAIDAVPMPKPVSPGTAVEQIRDQLAYLTSEVDRYEADAEGYERQAARSRALAAGRAELRSQYGRILAILDG